MFSRKQAAVECLMFFGWWLATALIIFALLSGCTTQQRVRIGTAISCTDQDCGTQSRRGTTSRCAEDMPCWNCHSMGNHVCGPAKGN